MTTLTMPNATRAATGLTARDLMRPPVASVSLQDHLAAAAYLMRHRHSDTVVVTSDDDAETPVAVVTAADITRATARGLDPEQLRLFELVTHRIAAVGPMTAATDAATAMRSYGVRYLPVVDDGRLVGLLHLRDVVAQVDGGAPAAT
jgi:CBS domain-containing protein